MKFRNEFYDHVYTFHTYICCIHKLICAPPPPRPLLQVALVTFNDYTSYTPRHLSHPCFADSMASAIAPNINMLLEYLDNIVVSGSSRYEYALETAFKFLIPRAGEDTRSERRREKHF